MDRFLAGQDGPLATRTGDELASEFRRAVWLVARQSRRTLVYDGAITSSLTFAIGIVALVYPAIERSVLAQNHTVRHVIIDTFEPNV
jgi:hypothetical protein